MILPGYQGRLALLMFFSLCVLPILHGGTFLALPEAGVQQGEAFSLLAWEPGIPTAGDCQLSLFSPRGSRRDFRLESWRLAQGTIIHATIAMDLDAEPGIWKIEIHRISGSPSALAQEHITVRARNYPLDVLRLDRSMSKLRTSPDPRKTEESRVLARILDAFTPLQSGSGRNHGLVVPITGPRQTSYFGEKRTWYYSDGTRDSSRHFGLDFGGESLEIRAMASGRIVFSGVRMITGNTIVIEHAPGLMSLYYHLSRLDAVQGMVVEPGQLLGLSGKTGLATGPHLHWELRAQLVPADPLSLDRTVILDKSQILGIISMSLHP